MHDGEGRECRHLGLAGDSGKQCHTNIHAMLSLTEVDSARINIALLPRTKNVCQYQQSDYYKVYSCSQYCDLRPGQGDRIENTLAQTLTSWISSTRGSGCIRIILVLARVSVCAVMTYEPLAASAAAGSARLRPKVNHTSYTSSLRPHARVP